MASRDGIWRGARTGGGERCARGSPPSAGAATSCGSCATGGGSITYACMAACRTARSIAKSAAAQGSEMLPACASSVAAAAELRSRYACVHIGPLALYNLHVRTAAVLRAVQRCPPDSHTPHLPRDRQCMRHS